MPGFSFGGGGPFRLWSGRFIPDDQFDPDGNDNDRPDNPPAGPMDNADLVEQQQSAEYNQDNSEKHRILRIVYLPLKHITSSTTMFFIIDRRPGRFGKSLA